MGVILDADGESIGFFYVLFSYLSLPNDYYNVFLSLSSLPYVPTLLFFTTARLPSFHYFALFHLDSALLSIEPLSLSLSTVFLPNFFAFLCFLTCTDLYSYLLPTTLRFKFFIEFSIYMVTAIGY